MKTILKNHKDLVNRTKGNIGIHDTEIQILAEMGDHGEETENIIKKQNAQRLYLELLDEVTEELIERFKLETKNIL